MKDIRPALREILLGDPAVVALVGQRVYPVRLPQGEANPSVVYNRVTELPGYHMAGSQNLSQTRVQFDAWATTADVAAAVANAVFDALSGFAGIAAGVTLQGVFQISGRETFDTTAQKFQVTRDFYVWYREQ